MLIQSKKRTMDGERESEKTILTWLEKGLLKKKNDMQHLKRGGVCVSAFAIELLGEKEANDYGKCRTSPGVNWNGWHPYTHFEKLSSSRLPSLSIYIQLNGFEIPL